MNAATKKVTKRVKPGPSIAGRLGCVGLTISICVGNSALFTVAFPEGGSVVALAFVLTTGFLAGGVHGVALGARTSVPRWTLYLTAALSWTVVVSIWLLVVAALTDLWWPAMLTLGGLGAAGFVPVAAGIETSRAWLARRWIASSSHEEGAASWADPAAEGSKAC